MHSKLKYFDMLIKLTIFELYVHAQRGLSFENKSCNNFAVGKIPFQILLLKL